MREKSNGGREVEDRQTEKGGRARAVSQLAPSFRHCVAVTLTAAQRDEGQRPYTRTHITPTMSPAAPPPAQAKAGLASRTPARPVSAVAPRPRCVSASASSAADPLLVRVARGEG